MILFYETSKHPLPECPSEGMMWLHSKMTIHLPNIWQMAVFCYRNVGMESGSLDTWLLPEIAGVYVSIECNVRVTRVTHARCTACNPEGHITYLLLGT